MYTMEPRLRASQRNGGQGFFELFVADPPRERPFRAAAIIVKEECLKKSRIITE